MKIYCRTERVFASLFIYSVFLSGRNGKSHFIYPVLKVVGYSGDALRFFFQYSNQQGDIFKVQEISFRWNFLGGEIFFASCFCFCLSHRQWFQNNFIRKFPKMRFSKTHLTRIQNFFRNFFLFLNNSSLFSLRGCCF